MRSAVAVVAMLVVSGCGSRARGGGDAPRAAATAIEARPSSTQPAALAPGAIAPMTGGASLYVDQLAVWDQPIDALSPTARAYLARLARLQQAYATAPRPPATFTADPAGFARWAEATLQPGTAPHDQDTQRLVEQFPRSHDESPAERRFYLLLQIVERHASARYFAALVGGPPGYGGCPHDAADHLARTLTELASDAERCAAATGGGPDWQRTVTECARRATWARQLLATAPPPAPDQCLEDMPDTGH